jgi:hypothetical protein
MAHVGRTRGLGDRGRGGGDYGQDNQQAAQAPNDLTRPCVVGRSNSKVNCRGRVALTDYPI